ncbi:MAG: flagellar type III secretion system pore protein FliP [Proteobacteria bacterium]|nr:flagellar type III secretion system pore protein FliP [Pseudomonadota bacterium]
MADISMGDGAVPTGALVLGMALLPFALVMLTCFTKLVVVLSLLRHALGVPSVPPNVVVTGLALALTGFVLAPLGSEIAGAVAPALESRADSSSRRQADEAIVAEVIDRAREPVRRFLAQQTRAGDRAMFAAVARDLGWAGEPSGQGDFAVLIPAFLTSELHSAFAAAFLLFLPFLVIDLVVASTLLALGMSTMSPTAVSLPLKLLLFVLADGWQLVARGLALGYA